MASVRKTVPLRTLPSVMGRRVGALLALMCAAVVGGCEGGNGPSRSTSVATPSRGGASTSRLPSTTSRVPSSPATIPSKELWPAPSDPLARAVAAGLRPEVKESLTFHVHAHLDVFVNGTPVVVPAGIGINTDDPGVKKFPEADGSTSYGGIQGCAKPCISPLHTHDISGILHTESATPRPNTLGQFFVEWGVRLDQSCVATFCRPTPTAIYIDGVAYRGDRRAIQLTDHREIAIVIGTPPAKIPRTADFSAA